MRESRPNPQKRINAHETTMMTRGHEIRTRQLHRYEHTASARSRPHQPPLRRTNCRWAGVFGSRGEEMYKSKARKCSIGAAVESSDALSPVPSPHSMARTPSSVCFIPARASFVSGLEFGQREGRVEPLSRGEPSPVPIFASRRRSKRSPINVPSTQSQQQRNESRRSRRSCRARDQPECGSGKSFCSIAKAADAKEKGQHCDADAKPDCQCIDLSCVGAGSLTAFTRAALASSICPSPRSALVMDRPRSRYVSGSGDPAPRI